MGFGWVVLLGLGKDILVCPSPEGLRRNPTPWQHEQHRVSKSLSGLCLSGEHHSL